MSIQFSSKRAFIKTLNPPILEQRSVFFNARFLINSTEPFFKISSLSFTTNNIEIAACAKITGKVFSDILSHALINLKH
jgi:hypothetical protein